MNPEIKEQWISALRSGDYIQGTLQLRRADNTYCCLGVLMDLAEKAGVECSILDPQDGWYYKGAWGPDGSREYHGLTPAVMEWAGIDSPVGRLPRSVSCYVDGYEAQSGSLVDLNDATEADFGQIADVIEELF